VRLEGKAAIVVGAGQTPGETIGNGRAQAAFRKVGFEMCGTSWRDGHTFIVMEVRREWVLETAIPERRREAVA